MAMHAPGVADVLGLFGRLHGTYGARIKVRGCDLWTFRDGAVVRKDSFWKIRTYE